MKFVRKNIQELKHCSPAFGNSQELIDLFDHGIASFAHILPNGTHTGKEFSNLISENYCTSNPQTNIIACLFSLIDTEGFIYRNRRNDTHLVLVGVGQKFESHTKILYFMNFIQPGELLSCDEFQSRIDSV